MEPEIREFFKRLSASIGMCIIWMTINITIGIKFGYAFFEDKIHWSNVVFYIWVLLSLAALIYFYIWLWKKPIENLEG